MTEKNVNFHHYSSIENHYKEKYISFFDDIFDRETTQFYGIEKIHGCNFSATVYENENEAITVKWGRRSSYLGDNELKGFHYSHKIKEKYSTSVVQLYNRVKESQDDVVSVQIFGELCGGKYPGQQTNDAKQVQKGVFYCPDVEFIIFDIYICKSKNENAEECKKQLYLDYDDVMTLCNGCNLPVAPIIIQGTLNQIFEFNPQFESQIYDIFNLPKVENNFAEGIVVKLAKNISSSKGRFIIKYKNPSFAEKNEKPKKIKNEPPKTDLTEEEQIIVNECLNYINENRLNSVLSKLTDKERNNVRMIKGLLIADAVKDIKSELDLRNIKINIIKKALQTHVESNFDLLIRMLHIGNKIIISD